MEKITSASCRSCGICCVSLTNEAPIGKGFVKKNVVLPRLVDRLAHALDGNQIPDGAIKTVWTAQKAGPLKGTEVCACAALRGSVMHRVSCSVYENRPGACRISVVPGDRACREVRGLFQRLLDKLEEE